MRQGDGSLALEKRYPLRNGSLTTGQGSNESRLKFHTQKCKCSSLKSSLKLATQRWHLMMSTIHAYVDRESHDVHLIFSHNKTENWSRLWEKLK